MTKIKSNNKTTKAKACKGTTTICKSSFKNKKVSTGTKILLAIAQKHKLGEESSPGRHDVASIAGCATKFESFRVTCNNHKKKGLLEFPDSKTVKLTSAGWKFIGDDLDNLPKTNKEHQQLIMDEKQIKGGKPTLMFQYLLDGRTRTKQEIARAAGYDEVDFEAKKDSIRVNITSLNKFTKKMDDGKIRLSDKVFPFGRPAAA